MLYIKYNNSYTYMKCRRTIHIWSIKLCYKFGKALSKTSSSYNDLLLKKQRRIVFTVFFFFCWKRSWKGVCRD